jgi:hypothetical protein
LEKQTNQTDDYIQCSGFCGDPGIIRDAAQRLLSTVNCGSSVESFLKLHEDDFIQRERSNRIDPLDKWVLDTREIIVSLSTAIALGCRRLIDSDSNSSGSSIVGVILIKSGHDKHLSNGLPFRDACSRLIHAKKWFLKAQCESGKCPGNILKIDTEAGSYEICLAKFAYCAWLLTTEFPDILHDGLIYSAPSLS